MKSSFKVADAIEALASKKDPEILFFHLGRCLAWAFLDQQKGDRSKRKNRARNARHVGRILLGRKIHPIIVKSHNRRLSNTEKKLLAKFEAFGGIHGLLTTPTPDALVSTFRENEKYTRTVHQLVVYLCQAENIGLPKNRRTIKAATEHLIANVRGEAHSSSKITQAWEKYAPSAALIYAAYIFWPHISDCCASESKSVSDLTKLVRSSLKRLSESPDDVRRFIGYASYAAQVIRQTNISKAFTGSFVKAKPVKPPMAASDSRRFTVTSFPSVDRRC
jgi:hypothetical protein